jgi:hypothetical protein
MEARIRAPPGAGHRSGAPKSHRPPAEPSASVRQDRTREGWLIADRKYGGVTIGGIVVIVGVLMMLFVSLVIGLIVTLIGLVAFGGFVRGKWY